MKRFIQSGLLSLVAAAVVVSAVNFQPHRGPVVAEQPRIGGWLKMVLHKADPQIPGKFRSYFYAPKHNLIVNAGETALRDCFISTSCTATQSFKFHGLGTGATAAAEADTACQTELTTQYNPDSTRATGSQTNNGANVYRTVGTNTVDASAAVTEWCLMSNASVGSGTLWSRVVFSAINLANGDSLQTTYDLTIE
jgi:hypothetical protein